MNMLVKEIDNISCAYYRRSVNEIENKIAKEMLTYRNKKVISNE